LPEPALNDKCQSIGFSYAPLSLHAIKCVNVCVGAQSRVVTYAMMAWGALARCSTATSTISSAVGTNGMLTSDQSVFHPPPLNRKQ
jgi:hypothetical protein